MKTRSLTYSLERNNFAKTVAADDFLAMLETGRMLNALGTAAEGCLDTYLNNSPGFKCAEAASFLVRLTNNLTRLMQFLGKTYYDEPCFEHFREMFSGGVRDFPGLTARRLRPAEFRLISTDPAISKAIRQLDVFGVDILFPRDRVEQAEAFHEEGQLQFEFGRYAALREKDNLDRQYLIRSLVTVYDFAIGAEIFIKAIAKRLGLRVDRSGKGAAVKAAAGSI